MNENILFRINQIAENEGITITALETKIGASKGVLSRALQKGTDISSKWISAVVENYPHYNAMWLLTGGGKMVIRKESSATEYTSHYMAQREQPYGVKNVRKLKGDGKKDIQLIPLYEIKATAGVIDLLTDTQRQRQIPLDYIQIPNMPKCDGALPITGDSMYPLLKSGDIVLFKEVHDKSNIIWGEMYLAAIRHNGDEFFFSKYIQKSDREGYARFVSENRHHQPVEFPIDSIVALALIKASIRFQSAF